jgi:SAM-dependent methyltransferase
MPSLSQNVSIWNEVWDWSQQGDEWSAAWGGVSHQWWTTLFPRIQGYVPAGRMIEIAPGYGRWTHFLRDLCDELIVVDIAETAIAYCRERFAADAHVHAHVNDGTSLAMAADGSVDFVFSFDSLVHAERDVLAGYLGELRRILAGDGVAFLHHSNMAAYPAGSFDPNNIHWRATSVSGQVVAELAVGVGLRAVSQETVMWGNDQLLNDCFSVIARPGSRWDRDPVVVENRDFSSVEIAFSRRLSTLYPPSHPEIRFGGSRRAAVGADELGDLATMAREQPERARELLLARARATIDSEALNDLAVLSHMTGRREQAEALLRALAQLFPEDAEIAQNLAALHQC